MDISRDEYGQERQIFDFCRWINQKLYDLEKEPDFSDVYFERAHTPNWKKFLEEAIPISYLGLYLYRAWRDVVVQCFTDNPQYDAKIMVHTGNNIKTISVEITTTEDKHSAMRRQALNRNGFVYFDGLIKREGYKVVSEPEFVDVDEEGSRIVTSVLERLERKLQNRYDRETAILIYVTDYQVLYPHHRFHLMEKVRILLSERRPALYGVFVCYFLNLGVDEIINVYE